MTFGEALEVIEHRGAYDLTTYLHAVDVVDTAERIDQ